MQIVDVSPRLLDVMRAAEDRKPIGAGEWDDLVEEAEVHGLLWHLAGATDLSADMRANLRDRSLLVVARNLALAGELRSCLAEMSAEGVGCVPIRGVALMQGIYGGIAPRPMGDIDLLVRRSETDELRRVLSRLGYREMDRRHGFSEEFSYSLKFLVERQFTIVVEPHLSLAYPPAIGRLDMAEVWARCVPATVVGEPALRLCVEDLLLHLALHVAHREDPPLVWLWEMDRVVQLESDTLEWARFAEMARRVGVERTVAGVLTEVRSLFQTPISSEVLDSLGAGSDTVNRRLSQRLAEDPTLTEREGLAQLLAIAGWRRKARYLCALLLPTTDFMMQQYSLRNRLQLPWAYLRRAAYFTWQGAKGAHRLLAQKRSY